MYRNQWVKWDIHAVFKVFVYIAILIIIGSIVPNPIWDPDLKNITLIIGLLGVWRYSWWFANFIRSQYYTRFVYPQMARQAKRLWDAGWRPRHVHFKMVTFREDRFTTERVVEAICHEIKTANVPGTIWLGSAFREDEEMVKNYIQNNYADLDLRLNIIRQNQPGKRIAMGLALRAMNRSGIHDDDLIVFMDGDFIFRPGLLSRCCPLFKLFKQTQAVTTHEDIICHGPKWFFFWLKMRFAQRHMYMQSHALSRRVLTLTGRFSMFRAKHLVSYGFTRIIESDHLNHWLWGDFRFLSGDDKSTWYYLLQQDSEMLYVPDVTGYTIEHIEGNGIDRMIQNMLRWSGNILRNGARALMLGPSRMPFFIWWAILDQRVSIWTMLVAPIMATLAAIFKGPLLLVGYLVWICSSRLLLSFILWFYSDRIYLSFPFYLFMNQTVNAGVKVYALFRLIKQKWANRGNQTSGVEGTWQYKFKMRVAAYLTTIYVGALTLYCVYASGLVDLPPFRFAWRFWFG
jgi:glycosyltransferase Alg8